MARDAGEYPGKNEGTNTGGPAWCGRRWENPGVDGGQENGWENIALGQNPGGAGAPAPTHSCGSVSVTSRR